MAAKWALDWCSPQRSTAEAWLPLPSTPPAKPLLHSPALHQLFLTSNLTSPPVLHIQCSGVLPPARLPPSVPLSPSLSVNTAGLHSRVLRCGLTSGQMKDDNPPVSNDSEIQMSTVREMKAFFHGRNLMIRNLELPKNFFMNLKGFSSRFCLVFPLLRTLIF